MFSIGIVAHQSRTTQAKNLAKQVKADFISIDTGLLGCDDNHTTVQNHLWALKDEWSVILEDDAQPVQDFPDQLTQALTVAPTPIVSLYLGRRRPPHFQHGGRGPVAGRLRALMPSLLPPRADAH